MYLPALFREDRVPVLHEAIARAGLATLVTSGPDGIDASHVPMLLDPSAGPLGTLCGHVARANPQWRERGGERQALAIFLGPDAYVTPSWYPTKRRTGEVVPTWNYLAVHAHGPVRFFDDEQRLLAIVTRLTAAREDGRREPWRVGDAPDAYVRGMLKAIVGFELPVARLEGKWKMSQNRSPEDREGVARGLAQEGRPDVAALVKARGPE